MLKRTIRNGERYGRLTVLCEAQKKGSKRYFECLCDCGTTKVVQLSKLGTTTKSCGCMKSEMARERATSHGKRWSKTYYIWLAMRQRCTNPKVRGFVNYGARGVTVHQSWNDYSKFLEDMGECPEGHSIERVDNDGNYEPGNCKWIPRGDQNKNTRRNRRIQLDGVRKNLSDWARDIGLHPRALGNRLKHGWSVRDALTTPKGVKPAKP